MDTRAEGIKEADPAEADAVAVATVIINETLPSTVGPTVAADTPVLFARPKSLATKTLLLLRTKWVAVQTIALDGVGLQVMM